MYHGIHQDHVRASFFRFALSDEHIPCHIFNAYCQTMVQRENTRRRVVSTQSLTRCVTPAFLHILDVQILEDNRTELIHQFSGSLVSKVEPYAGDPFWMLFF